MPNQPIANRELMNPPTPSTAGAAIGASARFPTSELDRAMLDARAKRMGERVKQEDEEAKFQYVRFRLGANERYGIPYRYLDEILPIPDITTVPCTPKYIRGVANYRGDLLTLIDLTELFRVTPSASTADAMLLVVKANGSRAGFIVDDIEGNDEFTANSLAARLPSAGVSNMDYVLGIHAGSITLLNLDILLADPALMVNETVT